MSDLVCQDRNIQNCTDVEIRATGQGMPVIGLQALCRLHATVAKLKKFDFLFFLVFLFFYFYYARYIINNVTLYTGSKVWGGGGLYTPRDHVRSLCRVWCDGIALLYTQ